MKILEKKWIIITLASFLFIGCSGGDSKSNNDITNITFPSSAVTSEATIENGKKVKEVVANDQQSTYSINAISNSNTQNASIIMKKINEIVSIKTKQEVYSLNETINETETCENGGSVNISGTGSQTTGGSFTLTFNSCNEYNTLMNGKLLTTLSEYNSEYDDFTHASLTFLSDLSISSEGVTMKIYAGSSVKTEFSDLTYYAANKMKMTVSSVSEIDSVKSGQENAIYYFDLSYYNPSMYQTQGKIYINNLASYVEYDTSYDMSKTPFVFSYSGIESGEARYNMAGNGKVKIVAEGGKAVSYVDANGDGTYELSEVR